MAELMVAIGLLSAVILLVIGVFISGLRMMDQSEAATEASSIGTEVIEGIRDEGGFSSIPSGEPTFDGSIPNNAINGFPPSPYPKDVRQDRKYAIKVEVKRPSAHMAAVRVTVTSEKNCIELEKVFHAAESIQDNPAP